MRSIRKLAAHLWQDEQGGEVLEYAIVAGLVVVGAIAFITTVGGKVSAGWKGVSAGLP